MSTNDEQRELLEIYKIHAELADRVSQRRDGANKLYASLITALMGATVVSIRFVDHEYYFILIAVGILGMALNTSWILVIQSYNQLNTGKFKALQEIEKNLVYPFFKKESQFLEGKYRKLTMAEKTLPYILYLAFVSMIIFGMLSLH